MMKAMILERLCSLETERQPLKWVELPKPQPKANELLIKVSACGVCHTELDEIEGRAPPPQLPVILGHQVVGRVAAIGQQVDDFHIGDHVGVAWIFTACGKCQFCLSDQENLCTAFTATGRDANGGYAQYMTVAADFAYTIPTNFLELKTGNIRGVKVLKIE